MENCGYCGRLVISETTKKRVSLLQCQQFNWLQYLLHTTIYLYLSPCNLTISIYICISVYIKTYILHNTDVYITLNKKINIFLVMYA